MTGCEEAIEELLDVLTDVIHQACWDGGNRNQLDSMAVSAYADGIYVLAANGRVAITHEAGRRVIAERIER
jgi:hypothetical protein